MRGEGVYFSEAMRFVWVSFCFNKHKQTRPKFRVKELIDVLTSKNNTDVLLCFFIQDLKS